MGDARRMFLQALKYKDDLQEAKDELAMLDRADERATLISAGDAKFASAKWAEALAEYQKASQLQMSDDLATKMVECRFRIALGEAVVVVGGRHSANTRHLAETCMAMGVPTYHIERAEELRTEWFADVRRVGVTAGTSTPDDTVAEVVERLRFLGRG